MAFTGAMAAWAKILPTGMCCMGEDIRKACCLTTALPSSSQRACCSSGEILSAIFAACFIVLRLLSASSSTVGDDSAGLKLELDSMIVLLQEDSIHCFYL